jgi:hypothetical protein
VVEVAEGRTTVVAFFGLSSSLKKKITQVQEKEKIKRKKTWRKGWSTLTSQATRRYQGQNP